MSVLELETDYSSRLAGIPERLGDLMTRLRIDDGAVARNEITQAILIRAAAHYTAQKRIKELLDKHVVGASSDFFVETVLFYLKAFLRSFAPAARVSSEEAIIKRRGAMRPDISVWVGDQIIAAVECKTQLGWDRSGWLPVFERREQALHLVAPWAPLYLVVLTNENWSGFDVSDARTGHQWAVLTKVWPDSIHPATARSAVVYPIEPIFQSIAGLVRSGR